MQRLAEWLSGVYQNSIAQMEVLEEAYNVLANTVETADMTQAVLDAAYPVPKQLPEDAAKAAREKDVRELDFTRARRTQVLADKAAREKYVRELEFASTRRREILRLRDGAGQGSTTAAAQNTAFGLFNAVAELIDYGVPGNVRRMGAKSGTFGSGAAIKHRVLNTLLKAAA